MPCASFSCLTVPVELAAMFRYIVVGIAEIVAAVFDCVKECIKLKLNLWLTAPRRTTPTRLLQLTGRWQHDGIM